MLKELLLEESPEHLINGVSLYKVHTDHLPLGTYFPSEAQKQKGGLEVFYVISGEFSIENPDTNKKVSFCEHDILICCETGSGYIVDISSPLSGILVTMEDIYSKEFLNSFWILCDDRERFSKKIREILFFYDGILPLRENSWNDSFFAVLRSLSVREESGYCIMKTAELLYLLCAKHSMRKEILIQKDSEPYNRQMMYRIRNYMEKHLDEKLTIAFLSGKFHISPTTLKTGFRGVFNEPVHTWLQKRRMQKSAELLQFSSMTVLEIAQCVGYEGVSQFNLLFKRTYGVTPKYYRKMSNNVYI